MTTRPDTPLRRLGRDRLAVFCIAVIAAYGAIALLCATGLLARDWALVTPDAWAEPSRLHPFGTNRLGQDVLARAMYSIRPAFEIGLVVALLSTFLGAVLGGLAGYSYGSWLDEAVLWLKGVIDAIPFYLLVAAVAYLVSSSELSLWHGNPFAIQMTMIAAFWTDTGRLVRGEVASLREREFVAAARGSGASPPAVLLRHLLPNTAHILLVQATVIFVAAIKTEVVLGFLGLGIADGVSWGRMIQQGAADLGSGHANGFLAASALMTVLVLAVSLLGDAMQDALSPAAAGNRGQPAVGASPLDT